MFTGCDTKGGGTSSGSSSDPVITGNSFVPDPGDVKLLFNHGTAGQSRFYNYCPSVFVENNKEHIYYCTNKDEGNVTDYVGYRTGVVKNNQISYTDTSFVLTHGESGLWDSRHDCDPSVVKGEFKFHGETYNYLMAFLGCVTSDCTLNETGIAVSKTPDGPWIKCDFKTDGVTKINPIVKYSEFDCSPNYWGTGQPSLISVDKKGKVILLTTIGSRTGTFTNVREYDFSNIDNYVKLKEKMKIPSDGVRQTYTGAAVISNGDFAYDPTNKRVLMVKERLNMGTDGLSPNFIGDTLDVYYMKDTEKSEIGVGDVLFAGNDTAMTWKLLGTINKSVTGFLRNHNAGLITDPYGYVLDTEKLGVAFTRSDEGTSNNWSYLSTYRIYATSVAFPTDYFNN